MKTQIPFTRDLLLIGGGHTHALFLKKWGMKPLPGVRVTLVNPGPIAAYSGMLPGYVAGHYSKADLEIDLIKLTRFADAGFIMDSVVSLDPSAKTAVLASGRTLEYDVASLDVGIHTNLGEIPGFAEHGVAAKPLDAFATRWANYRARATAPQIAVIGGGVAGVELALAMRHALADKSPEIHIIDRGSLLSGMTDSARGTLISALEKAQVQVHENLTPVRVSAQSVEVSDGRSIASDFTVSAAGARPHGFLADCGVELYDGSIKVGPTLLSSDPSIFAVGDCAYMTHDPRPKAGVFAVRQTPTLYANVRALLSNGSLQGYAPQKDYLKLISLGRKSALMEKSGFASSGALLWQWKNWIDQRFMRGLNELPSMKAASLPNEVASDVRHIVEGAPLCGGCGSKVGRNALSDALSRLDQDHAENVVTAAGDDAAVLRSGDGYRIMSTDHLRSFVNDADLMTRITAQHALNDIFAMGAQPDVVTMNVILPRMSPELQRRTMVTITQAASDVFSRIGVSIVGGHSSQGAEMTIGFTVNGHSTREPITVANARSGDVLILTKPIGSGVLLAAEMQGKARPQDVVAAYKWMLESQHLPSKVLTEVAHAMTDVTGFGLAGHLSTMCDASGVGAQIELNAVPVMEGAVELATTGIKSTIWQDNRDSVWGIDTPVGPKADLLFDPQTSGGLLAAVPASLADETVKKLKLCGSTAAVIGKLTDETGIRVI